MPVRREKTLIMKIVSAGTALFFICAFVYPQEALAGRSSAGGGTPSTSLDFGDFALAVGMSLGTFVVGGALNSAINAGAGALGSGAIGSIPGAVGNGFIDNLSNVFSGPANFGDTMALGFTTFAAGSELSRAAYTFGQYHNWDNQTKFIASNIATAVGAGMINPSAALGNTIGGGYDITATLRGAFVGGLGGLANGGLQMAIDPRSVDENRSPSAAAQIAGFAGSVFATNLGRTIVNPATYANAIIQTGSGFAPAAPDAGTIAARLTIGPVVDTLNAWPLLASNALGIIAADHIGDEKLKNPIRSVVSSLSAPLLEGFATAYQVKPSLCTDVDVNVLARPNALQQYRSEWLAHNNGSRAEAMKNTAWQVLKYELPVQVMSGGIQFGLAQMIKDKSLSKQMLLSLGAATATGLARGAVWYAYNQIRYNEEIDTGKPHVATVNTLKGSLLADAREKGHVAKPDNTPQSINVETRELYTKDEKSNMIIGKVSLDEAQAALDESGCLTIENPRTKEQVPVADVLYDKNMSIDDISKYFRVRAGTGGDGVKNAASFFNKLVANEQPVNDPEGQFRFAAPNQIALADGAQTTRVQVEGKSPMIFDGTSLPPEIKVQYSGSTVKNNEFSRLNSQYQYVAADGSTAKAEVQHFAKPVDFATTMALSLSQSYLEMGSQALSMGLPNVQGGQLDSIAWVNYSNNLASMSRAAGAGKLALVMGGRVVDSAMDVTSRNVLTTISNTPLGNAIGMPAFVPIMGYKGMPVSLVAVMDRGEVRPDRTAGTTMFYEYSPTRRVNVFNVDSTYLNMVSALQKQSTGVSDVNGLIKGNGIQSNNNVPLSLERK